MPAIGITGSIASGKSTLTSRLAYRLGAEVFDSDRFVHNLFCRSPETIAAVELLFGNDVITSERTVDRTVLGKMVFGQPPLLRKLEAIVHPRVREGWQASIKSASTEDRWLLIDIPLLFETNADLELPNVILVGCSRAVQLERLQYLRRIDREHALRVIDAQMEMPEKVKRAARVIWNDGSMTALESQVELLANDLLSR